jgi:hypothetical protein
MVSAERAIAVRSLSPGAEAPIGYLEEKVELVWISFRSDSGEQEVPFRGRSHRGLLPIHPRK